MPQNGFHGLIGLALGRSLARGVPAARPLAQGVLLGAILPDADLYPAALFYLAGHADWVYLVHRTFTHSLLLMGIFVVLSLRGPDQRVRMICRGVAIGMVSHITLDLFFWFSPVDLFWPLSHLPPGRPLLPVIDLWRNFRLPPVFGRPDLISNVLSSMEFAAFAGFIRLIGLTRATAIWERQTNEGSVDAAGLSRLEGLRAWERAAWTIFGVTFALAPVLSGDQQQILVSALYLLCFFPYTWIQAWKLHEKDGTREPSDERDP